jgi:hypothetical protein
MKRFILINENGYEVRETNKHYEHGYETRELAMAALEVAKAAAKFMDSIETVTDGKMGKASALDKIRRENNLKVLNSLKKKKR